MPVFKTDGHRGLALMGAGVSFGAIVAVMAYVGHRVDLWLGTEPWSLTVGALIGVTVASWDLIRTVNALDRRRGGDGR